MMTDTDYANEVEENDRLRDITDRAEDAERQAFEEAYVEVFCLSGFGHTDLDYTEGEGEHLPAYAECRVCGTVLS